MRRLTRSGANSIRRAFGQTRWARSLNRWRRARLIIPRAFPPDPSLLTDERDAEVLGDALVSAERDGRRPTLSPPPRPARAPAPRKIANVLLVSHCDFTGASALHAYRIADELHGRGMSPVLAVPDDPKTVVGIGEPEFPVVSYADVRAGRLSFVDGGAPHLVHAFTPRERVRKLTVHVVERARCPYVVHLEDNDRAVLAAELETSCDDLEQLPAPVLDRFIGPAQMHPRRGAHFVAGAAGVSVVIEQLLELVPPGLPTAVVRPGVDEAMLAPSRPRETIRAELGIDPGDFAVGYTGSIHKANVPDMRRLYVALSALRRDGHPVVLVKTGWNAPDTPELRHLGKGVRNLGWVPRSQLPDVLAATDVLVQPGVPGPFNDYRFPAKLPDLLASGRPVVVSRTNLGVALEHRRNAFILEQGNAAEMYAALETLRADDELARAIGEGGREFAVRELRWGASVDQITRLYEAVEAAAAPEAWTLELPPPVRVLAVVPEAPTAAEARLARRHGIFGFHTPDAGEPTDEPLAFSPDYETVLRHRVLHDLGTGGAHESVVVFVDPRGPIARQDWLDATRVAVREGIRRYYASRQLSLTTRTLDDLLPSA